MYYSIGDYYRKEFGGRIVKIPVGVVDDCPNRRGYKGMQVCTYCDVWGAAANEKNLTLPLAEQIERVRATKLKSLPGSKFLVYFQAYTSTLSGIEKMRREFEIALSFPDVRGLVIGTRPDCLSPLLLDLWNEFQRRTRLFIELGVESFDDEQLLFLRRGHTAAASIDAIQLIYQKCQLPVGIHLIFGLPNETLDDVKRSALLTSSLPIHNVKLHNLHVLKQTHLETLYHEGLFRPMEFSEYRNHVVHFLRHLSPTIAVQRLSGLSSRWDELIAPQWVRHKMESYQKILDYMSEQEVRQGDLFPHALMPEIGAH